MTYKKQFCGLVLLPVILILLSVNMFSDCDMIALLAKRTDLASLLRVPGDFNDPMDFYLYFGDYFIGSNPNGYGIIYRSLNNTFKIYEFPMEDPDNQVFREADPSNMDAYNWAKYRIFNEDGLDHRSYVVLAHARFASGGNNDIPDPHPFVWDYNGESTHYAFEHNGTVDKVLLRNMTQQLWASWHPGQIWSDIYPYKTEHQGNNELVDSEAYFHWLMCNIKLAGYDVFEGLRRALIPMRSWNSYKNFVFSDRLAIYCYKGLASAPSGHYLGYYDNPQFYGVLTGGNGTQVSNHGLVKMDFSNGRTNYTNFDLPTATTIPYSVGFENSSYDTCDSHWYLHSSNNYGRIVVSDANGPYAGTHHLTMDSTTEGQTVTNDADLYVDLTNQDRVTLKFYWKHFNDEYDAEDGIYFSDNNGSTFTQVYPLDVRVANPNTWYEKKLDVNSLCLEHGLNMNANFVIRFQQKGHSPINANGFAFDAIQIYRRYAKLNYKTGFENGFDEYWETSTDSPYGIIKVTSLWSPYAGLFHMLMTVSNSGYYATNSAKLYVDFSDCCCSYPGTRLKFQFKDFGDLNDPEDGIYFSDDRGVTFVKIFDLKPESWTDNVWHEIDLDLQSLAAFQNKKLSADSVIMFQQRGYKCVPSGGFVFDEVELYRTGTPTCW